MRAIFLATVDFPEPVTPITLMRCTGSQVRAARLSRLPVGLSPDLPGGLQERFELAELHVLPHVDAPDPRGETTLRADRKLLDRQVARGFLDAPLQLVHRFHVRAFGGHQA